jgi:hypothetical protein
VGLILVMPMVKGVTQHKNYTTFFLFEIPMIPNKYPPDIMGENNPMMSLMKTQLPTSFIHQVRHSPSTLERKTTHFL